MKTNPLTYKCCLCRKLVDDAMLTCAPCVNTGRFCPSKHDSCSNKRRQALVNLLNCDDQQEFHLFSDKHAINTPSHYQCSDRMFLLKKFNVDKKVLQVEYETRIQSTIAKHRMEEEIKLRKFRLDLVKESISQLRKQIEQEKLTNENIVKTNAQRRSRIETMKIKIRQINEVLASSNKETRRKDESRIRRENLLLNIRQQRLNEIYKYIFPIEHVLLIEEDLASTMRALSIAQQPIVDETNNDCSENDEALSVGQGRYQIVSSCLPVNGDYQIDKLLLMVDVDGRTPDTDSLQSTLSHELYEVLSALSHACQLINVIAFYLHIALPFRLHQLEFNTGNLTTDRLRADIAKLNANIISVCMSQGIPMESTNVTHTLENLRHLSAFKNYLSRPKPVIYSQQYITMIEEEVNEISRAYVTDYWFDDVERDVTDPLDSEEWATVPQDYNIPDDPSIQERVGSLPNAFSVQNPQYASMMNGSMGLINRSSTFITSVFRSFGRS